MKREPYIAFCWSTGLIQFGGLVPSGAIEVCRGPRTTVVREITVAARHGRGNTLLVPGVPESDGEKAKADALGLWLLWCASRSSKLLTWSVMDMGRQVVIPPLAVESACKALLANYHHRQRAEHKNKVAS